jgi:Na+-driven multidrug efflux pump
MSRFEYGLEKELDEETEEEIEEVEAKTRKRDSDKLGTEPVHPLLLKMSAPLAVSMFVMALYNIVDSIYLGHYSTDALTAVSNTAISIVIIILYPLFRGFSGSLFLTAAPPTGSSCGR